MNKLWFTTRVFCAVISILLLARCSDDSSTNPTPNQGGIILNKLAVSLVPGGSETVTVTSVDDNGAFSECGVTNDNPAAASCTITDSTLQISGNSLGTTNLTITNMAGRSCVLPVEVYDPNILDAGEFLIAYTNNYEWLGRPFFIPIPPEGFFALGAMGLFGWPGDSIAVITVKPKPGSDAIAFTDSFISDELYASNLWMPIPPPGYKAMGYVYDLHGMPDSQACIREDLTTAAEVDEEIFIDDENVWSLWKIEEPFCGPHARAYMAPGSFIAVSSINVPVDHPMANVLNVDLQKLAETPDQDFAPRLNSFSPPPELTAPTVGKAILAPFSVITDMVNNIAWQMNNSPTYRFERQVYYKCLYHNYNQSDVVQTNSFERVVGISTSQSETFRATAGISISAELGVSFSPAISGKIASTVSFEVGYERLTGITEFEERHVTTSLNIPPGKAGAIWQRYNRFTLYRHIGNSVEVVGAQEIGIESYVIDVYPDN